MCKAVCILLAVNVNVPIHLGYLRQVRELYIKGPFKSLRETPWFLKNELENCFTSFEMGHFANNA
jgi:hypothetical protein